MDIKLLESFWRYVHKTEDGSCWEWLGHIEKRGYGVMSYNNKRDKAHRISWRIANNQEIPKGMVIMHLCDNPICVNPNHLKLGTQDDNMKDCKNKGRITKSTGENHGRSKLTETDVLEIRRLIAKGKTNKEIANLHKTTTQNIQAIRINKTWKWLKGESND